ncbi:MAG: porin [Serpentinimonas sp.]|nr:porin [Serpentinimonas sp.]
MKKTLIAAAVLAASGAAMAQSSVQIYGTVDLWVGSTKDTAVSNQRTTKIDSSGLDTAKLGFRGSEDLGGGLKANFNLEAQISPDTGVGLNNGFNRISWLGLSGGFGEVQLGKVWSAFDDAFFPLLNNKAAIGFIVAPGLTYNDRPNNSIKYISPEFGGFTATGSFSLGENGTATRGNSNISSLAGTYAADAFTISAATQTEKLLSTGEDKRANSFIGGSYDFGVVSVVGTIKRGEETTGATEVKFNEYQFGVVAPLSDVMDVSFGYGRSQSKIAGIDQEKIASFGALLTYSLSKRTTLYTGFTRAKTTDQTVPGTPSTTATLYAAGINHNF